MRTQRTTISQVRRKVSRPVHAPSRGTLAEKIAAASVILGIVAMFFLVQPDNVSPSNVPAVKMTDLRSVIGEADTWQAQGRTTVDADTAVVLEVLGASKDDATAAMQALKDTGKMPIGRARATQNLALIAHFDANGAGAAPRLLAVSLKPDRRSTLLATRLSDDSFHTSILTARVQTGLRHAYGTIDTTLEAALIGHGATPQHINVFKAAFPNDPGIMTDTRPGERYQIVFEAFEDERGGFIEPGEALFVAYNGAIESGSWYRFTPEDTGRAEFFDATGRAVAPFLTRRPLDAGYVTSSFGYRRHPIFGHSHLHSGVDYAAPTGTRVYAGGDGEVSFVGRRDGYGRYIRIRHARGYETAYAHLSGFAADLKAGDKVAHGDLIGFVGKSGAVTGAHLHYEILKDGTYQNPQTLELPSGRNLARKASVHADFMAFKASIDQARGVELPSQTLASTPMSPRPAN